MRRAVAAPLQCRPTSQLLGLSGSGAGSDSACFDRFGYASAIEAGWRWDMPNSTLTIDSLPGGRSLESALSQQVTRLLYDHRFERHAVGWLAATCPQCGRTRPCSAESATRHVRILWQRRSTKQLKLNCDFCGASVTLPAGVKEDIDTQWTPGRPVKELAARTSPQPPYRKKPETDEDLLRLFDRLQRGTQAWKGNYRLGWRSLGFALLFATFGSAVIHFTGLGNLWMFNDGRGSAVTMLAIPVGGLIGALAGGRRSASALVLESLKTRLKTYELDADQLRRLAIERGRRYSSVTLALEKLATV